MEGEEGREVSHRRRLGASLFSLCLESGNRDDETIKKKKGETFRLRFGNPVLLSVSRMWRKGVLQKGGLLRPLFDKQKERSLHLTDPPRQSWSNLEQSIDGEQGTHIVQDSQPRSLVRDVNELVAKWQLRSLKIRRCKRRLRDSKAIEMQV